MIAFKFLEAFCWKFYPHYECTFKLFVIIYITNIIDCLILHGNPYCNVVEIFCLKYQKSTAQESEGVATFVLTRTGAATNRSCIGYTIVDVSTQGMYCMHRVCNHDTVNCTIH